MPMDDHDLLIRLDEKLTEVLRRLDGQDSRLSRIEGRVSALENFRWWVIGAAAASGSIASYIFQSVV
jgi:hypothetical protein